MLSSCLGHEDKMMPPKKTHLKSNYFPLEMLHLFLNILDSCLQRTMTTIPEFYAFCTLIFPVIWKMLVYFWFGRCDSLEITWKAVQKGLLRLQKWKRWIPAKENILRKKKELEKSPEEFESRNWFVLCSQDLWSSLRKPTESMNNN